MKKRSKEAKGESVDTFCARMLADSGLTYQDVTAHIFKKGDTQSIFEAKTFRPGTVDEYGNIVDGDAGAWQAGTQSVLPRPLAIPGRTPGQGRETVQVQVSCRQRYAHIHPGTHEADVQEERAVPKTLHPGRRKESGKGMQARYPLHSGQRHPEPGTERGVAGGSCQDNHCLRSQGSGFHF